MTAINFPDSPSNGDTHVVGGVIYTYDSTETKWKTTINSNAFLPLTGGTVSGNIVLDGELQHSGDTDTKLHFDTDTIKFDTAGSERFRIDSSGRLLVGTSTAINTDANAVIQAASSTGGYYIAARDDTSVTAGNTIGGMRFYGNDSDGIYDECARIECAGDGTHGDDSKPTRLGFLTTAGGESSPTERMRITSGGNVLVGTTSASETSKGAHFRNFSNGTILTVVRDNDLCGIFNRLNGDGGVFDFRRSSTTVGSISVTSTATTYSTSSDYRLKENVTAVTDGITRLQQLKPSRFNFIADPDTTVDGFIAHEAQAVVPECVTGTKDAVDDDGNPIYQGIDQSKLVPLLTAALQEAIAKIETLETRLTALEGGAAQ